MAANHYLLDTIQGVLEGTEWNASNQGTVLHLQHSTSPDLVGAVSVVPASIRETPIGTISDVIQVTTKLPPAISQFFKDDPKGVLLGNKVASTGALYAEDGEYYVGSRATIYEGEDVEVISLSVNFLVLAVCGGYESISQGLRILMGGEAPDHSALGGSAWTSAEIEDTHSKLLNICVCTSDGAGITAEFPLAPGAMSAAVGDQNTALFQIHTDVPHPHWGPGLFCSVEFPYCHPDSPVGLGKDDGALIEALNHLNRLEMHQHDRPPHYGAWCVGMRKNNPAYVTFLVNQCHHYRGMSSVPHNLAIWNFVRSKSADPFLRSAGFVPAD